MPSKKKKYNSRFPPARIKKIMQTDDEIGKVAAAVPVLISKCLEMFLTSILTNAGEVTRSKRAKTMSTSHLKECIMTVQMFDFLKDIVTEIPDMLNEDEPSTSASGSAQESSKKISKKRSIAAGTAPKKRLKLRTEASEEKEFENETDDDQEEHNGGLQLLSSPELISQEAKPGTTDEDQSSFHISLDALMSPESSSTTTSHNQMMHIIKPKGAADSLEMSAVVTNPTSILEKEDSSNGVSSPQKPMDLTVNSDSRAGAKPHRSYESAEIPSQLQIASFLKSEPSVQQPAQYGISSKSTQAMPSPKMPHFYRPAPSPHAENQEAISRDTNIKLSQDGIPSNLYSGELTPSVRAAVAANKNAISKTPQPVESEPIYPYNPINEHFKRQPPLFMTSLSVPSSSQIIPANSFQPKEDDDYDA